MSLWLPLMVPAAVTLLWLWLPGTIVGLALRLRPAVLWTVAPLYSVAIIALAAILAPFVGLPWGPLPAAGLVVLVGLAAWGLRLLLSRTGSRRGSSDPGQDRDEEEHTDGAPGRGRRSVFSRLTSVGALTAGAMVVAAALMARHVTNVLDSPYAMSQTFDNIFHQNAVRYILDGASASSLDLLSMTATPGDPTFYPAAWHDIVSLVLLTLGSEDIPLATNALILVVCTAVWPAGIILLTRVLLPSSLLRVGLLPAGVLAASVPLFPLLFIFFGVLYPNLLGLALMPALLVLVMRFLALGRREGVSWAAVVSGGLFGSIALSLAHPNASMSLIAMVIPMAAVAAVRAGARAVDRRSVGTWLPAAALAVFAVAVYLVAGAVWPIVRPPEEALTWPPIMTVEDAIGSALTMSGALGLPAWSLMVLFLAGAYASVRRRRVSMLAAWVVVTYLWVAIAAWPAGDDRTALVGVWYNDPMRLAAVLAIPAIPVAALGVAHLLAHAAHLLHAVLPRAGRRWSWTAMGALGAVLVLLLTQRTAWMDTAVDQASATYQLTADSQVLTEDERALIDELPDLVPADAVIITNAWNGSSLAYAFTGIQTSSKHTLEYVSPEDKVLEERLDEAASDPTVCAAVEDFGATYVLDFGEQFVNSSGWTFPGFEDLDRADGFTLVTEHGDAALYRIDACGP